MSDNNSETTQELYRKKVELGERGKQAQSAVSLAVGGGDSFDEPENRSKPEQGTRPQGDKNRRRDRKPRRDRVAAKNSRPRPERKPDQETAEKKPFLKPVNSRNSMEERLAYYKEKYGENFKPSGSAE
jgi:ATP-dependent RNA helicase RhlB